MSKTKINKASDAKVLTGINIPFDPEEGHVLVKLLPVTKVKKEVTVLDEEANKNKTTGEDGDVMETKTEIQEVEAAVRKAVVLRISSNERNKPAWKEGDTIIIKTQSMNIPFDIFKPDAVLVKRFEVLGKWLNE